VLQPNKCADLNSKIAYGKGFNFTTDMLTDKKNALIINKKKGLNINQPLRITSRI
jgi:hypothetical protein